VESPFYIEWTVRRAKNADIIDFIFVVCYLSESVMDHFKDGVDFGVRIDYAFQETQQGTGHALMTAEDPAADRFLILNEGVLIDISSLKRTIEADGLAVAAKKVSDPSRYGALVGEEGVLRYVVEKSPSPPSNFGQLPDIPS